MRLAATACKGCGWTFEGGRLVVYPKLAEPGPPPKDAPDYQPPKWAMVAFGCPACGKPMTFDPPVSVTQFAGVRQFFERSES